MNTQLETYYQYALDTHIPVISRDGAHFIKDHILKHNIKNVLEIGSAIGFSALFFAIETDALVYTIERDITRFAQMQKAVHDFGYADHITMHHDDALLHEMPEDYQCDLLFIDAAKAQNRRFLEKYSPYVKPGGHIIIDNLIFHDYTNIPLAQIESRNLRALVRKIIDFRQWISEHPGWNVTFYDEVGDGMAIITRQETIR